MQFVSFNTPDCEINIKYLRSPSSLSYQAYSFLDCERKWDDWKEEYGIEVVSERNQSIIDCESNIKLIRSKYYELTIFNPFEIFTIFQKSKQID